MKYTEADFHLPRPKPPTRDFRWYSLIIPPVGFSIGMVLFGLLGFSFVELRDMPALLRSNIVVMGSIGLAIGSELGTLPALLEVFRKVGAGRAGVWDWIGLGVSVLTSITILIMSWAWLLQIDILWSESIRTYGPLVLGSLAILDFTAGGIEAGLYLSTYDERQRRWQTDLEDWLIRMNGDQKPDLPIEEGPPMGMISHPVSLETVASETTVSPGPPVWTDGLATLLGTDEMISGEPCWCGWMQSGQYETPIDHVAAHKKTVRRFESAGEALDVIRASCNARRWELQNIYGMSLPDYPTVLEIVKWRGDVDARMVNT